MGLSELGKLFYVGVVILTSIATQLALGLPLQSANREVNDLDDLNWIRYRHQRAAFLPNDGQPAHNSTVGDVTPPRGNSIETLGVRRQGPIRVRRSSDYEDVDPNEYYYEGGGATEVGGGKRMIAFTVFFLWVCWVCIACSILRVVAKNLA